MTRAEAPSEGTGVGVRTSIGGLLIANILFVIIVAGSVGVLIPLALYLWSPLSWTLPIGVWKYLGLAPLLSGIAIYFAGIWQQMSEGEGTPSPLKHTNRLVTSGLYARVRNPMYVAGVLFFVGIAIFLRSGVLLAYAAIVAFVYYPLLVCFEEKNLERRFGSQFTDYCSRTPRWLPRVRRNSRDGESTA